MLNLTAVFLFFFFVRLCVRGRCLHTWSFDLDIRIALAALALLFRQGLSENLGLAISARLASQEAIRIDLSPVLSYRHTTIPSSNMHAGDSNSGPHTCIASALPNELSPQTQPVSFLFLVL